MTEDDYVLATNLAKVRVAIEVAASLYAESAHEKIALASVLMDLRAMESRWQERLAKRKGKKKEAIRNSDATNAKADGK